MADLSAVALQRLGERIPSADREAVARMLRYFDRSSLWLATAEGSGEDLVLILANEAERFRLPLPRLRELYTGLRRGQAVDWSKLDRLR